MNVKILFARIWGVIAIIFGSFFVFIGIYNFFKPDFTTENLLVYVPLIVFGFIFIFVGRFFLFTKMSDK
jgi:hypothetical protein